MPAAGDSPGRTEMLVLNVRGGARLCVPADLEQLTPYILLEQEDWFEDEIRFVRRWLRPGMRVVDVGANYGVYTVAAALSVGPSGRVWAFEPTPRSAHFLQRSLELNDSKQVLLSPLAVSDHAGEVPFLITRSPEHNSVAAAGASLQGAVALPATTLDDMAEQHGWTDMDFIKLDVEGHETQVIQGGAAFLASNSPLVMFEVRTGCDFNFAGLELLVAMGYSIYRLLPGPLLLVPFRKGEPLDASLLNLFACKSDRALRLAAEGILGDPAAARIGGSSKDPWGDYARSAPYARALAAGWPSRAGYLGGADDKAYFEALAAFARSRAPEQSADQQCAWLCHAFDCIGRAIESGGSLAKQMTYARLAWETGRRDAAIDTLFLAKQRLESEAEQALSEPFLPPGERYDSVPGAARPADWLRCAVIEQLEKLRAFSSSFIRDTTPEILRPIMDLPFRSPEMDRRWQLVRMTTGEQAQPEPAPELCVRSAENLNPEFWCGAHR